MHIKLFFYLSAFATVISVLVLNASRRTGFAVPLSADFTARAPAMRPRMPPIDAEVPARIETATFAMG